MPKVTVSCQSNCSTEEAFSRVRKVLENDQDLRKLDAQYKCQFDETKLTGQANGKHFKAQMSIAGKDLPLALSLAKGLVQKTLQRKLDQALLA
jgi:hypothetical protein